MTRDEFLAQPAQRQTVAVAESHCAALQASPEWKAIELPLQLRHLMQSSASPQRALRELGALADAVGEAQKPYAVCKRGCDHCCHIAVTISAAEAMLLAEASGREMSVEPSRGSRAEETSRWRGVPCPFLVDHECSVYAARPMACRLHANLGDNPDHCDTAVPPKLSLVCSLDLKLFWMVAADRLGALPHADIREFFPAT